MLDHNEAHIPCKVTGLEDLLSKYSIKGCESASAELIDYVRGYVKCIPVEYPVILDIYGPKFTPQEQETIKSTITSELNYLLGETENEIKHNRKMFRLMMLGTIVTGFCFTTAKKFLNNAPLEFSYVIFWLFADTFVRYIFIDWPQLTETRIRMGRLACMKVEFHDALEE